jgi:site-specific DNA recombinase
VVGEYERAFMGQQLEHLAPVLRRHGVALWLLETHGPVDFDNRRHLAMIDLLGVQSQREVSRSRFRTMAAMRAQTETQGRHLGGRPPYGYRLVDAGPHPNRVHATWGRRLHRLDPDPTTAPHVRWIFEQRLAGHSVAGIARDLNDRGVPCPSKADPARNLHRSGDAWMITTVAAILANPRYTGRQVWNRQPAHHGSLTGQAELFPAQTTQQRGASSEWVISRRVVHPPLVSEKQFVQVQAVHTAPTPTDDQPRTYLLAGLVFCGICGRLMDSHWVHGRAGYRCRHGRTSAHPAPAPRPKILYVREDRLIARIRADPRLAEQMGTRSDPRRIARHLLANDMVVVCDHTVWAIESDTLQIELATVDGLGLTPSTLLSEGR